MFLAFLFAAIGAIVAIVAEVLKHWQQWNDMPEKRFLALLKSREFWAVTVFLILLGGSMGAFEATRRHPIDWSLSFFVGVGAISTVRNILSGAAAHESPRAKRRRLKRHLSYHHGSGGGLTLTGKRQRGKGTRQIRKATLVRPQESVLAETEQALQKAIRLHPQNAEAHYISGVLLKELGRLEEAGQAFQNAIQLNLQNAEAQYNLGVLMKESGRFAEAERAFQEAIRLNPQDAGLLQERSLEKLSSLSETADIALTTPIGWRDIFH
jgi:tetratricopeptide (TPR) repeat protein